MGLGFGFATSTTTALIDAALAKAQGEIETALADQSNPHFKSKYADLASLWTAARKSLSANALSVTQWPVTDEKGELMLATRVAHKGEWILSSFIVPMEKKTAHGMGAALTYARRFAFGAAIGIVSEEDDDGNTASGRPNPQPTTKQSAPMPYVSTSAKAVITPKQTAGLTVEMCGGKELADMTKFAKELGLDTAAILDIMQSTAGADRLSLVPVSKFFSIMQRMEEIARERAVSGG